MGSELQEAESVEIILFSEAAVKGGKQGENSIKNLADPITREIKNTSS